MKLLSRVRLFHKINLTLLIAVGVAALFWFIHYYGKEELLYHSAFVSQLDALEREGVQLNGHLLEVKLSAYPNYDDFNEHIERRRRLHAALLSEDAFEDDHHHESLDVLRQLGDVFTKTERLIRDFQRLHSTLRNSSLYVHRMAQRLIVATAENGDSDKFRYIFGIIDAISISSNLQTNEWLPQLHEKIAQAERAFSGDWGAKHGTESFLAHARLFANHFSDYLAIQHELDLVGRQGQALFAQLRTRLELDGQEELNLLVRLSYAIFLSLMLAEALIVYFLIKAERAANLDDITGIGNRRAIQERMRAYRKPCLFLISLDQFSHVNSIYGSRSGDELLRQVVGRLSQRYSDRAELFRVGSNSFALLFDMLDGSQYNQMSFDLLSLLEDEAYEIQGIPVRISCSVSIADIPPLLEHANIVLTDLKRRRHAKHAVYSSNLGLEARIEGNLKILEQLKSAIDNDRIRPYFQPIFCNRTGRIDKHECLIRLETSDGNVIPPMKFLPIARESGLYVQLTRIMVEKSFSYFRDKPGGFSINLSPDDILNMETMAHIFAALDSEPDLAKRATFEILESEKVQNWDAVKEFIHWAQGLGSRIAIDDFGAGYSNFETILALHIDYIKIDGSLIKSIDTDRNAEMVTRSILEFAREIGVKTVVEFVHSEMVHAKVCELGADFSQGYHLGMPMADIMTQPEIAVAQRG
jgi:diguanylate cyclase (GGDEF)-like protein